MAHDPLSHVASWIAPAAANLSITTADVNDPLIALIRERDRLYRLAEDTRERQATALEEQAGELHDQICDTPAGSFDALLWQLELARDYFENEGLLDTIIAGVKRLAGPGCSLELVELMKAERTPDVDQAEEASS